MDSRSLVSWSIRAMVVLLLCAISFGCGGAAISSAPASAGVDATDEVAGVDATDEVAGVDATEPAAPSLSLVPLDMVRAYSGKSGYTGLEIRFAIKGDPSEPMIFAAHGQDLTPLLTIEEEGRTYAGYLDTADDRVMNNVSFEDTPLIDFFVPPGSTICGTAIKWEAGNHPVDRVAVAHIEDVPLAAHPERLDVAGLTADVGALAPRDGEVGGKCQAATPDGMDQLPAVLDLGGATLKLGKAGRAEFGVRIPAVLTNDSALDPVVAAINIVGISSDGFLLDTGYSGYPGFLPNKLEAKLDGCWGLESRMRIDGSASSIDIGPGQSVKADLCYVLPERADLAAVEVVVYPGVAEGYTRGSQADLPPPVLVGIFRVE